MAVQPASDDEPVERPAVGGGAVAARREIAGNRRRLAERPSVSTLLFSEPSRKASAGE